MLCLMVFDLGLLCGTSVMYVALSATKIKRKTKFGLLSEDVKFVATFYQ